MPEKQPKTLQEARELLGLETFEFDRLVIGKLLKSARDSLGKRLKDIELGSGVAASHIWNIERGNKDVTVERLAKLACFYGFPPGLLIEAGVRVNSQPIHQSAMENVNSVIKEWGWSRVSQDRKSLISEFVAGTATVMVYLLRSTRPAFLIETFDFPSIALKHRCRLIAGQIEYRVAPVQRALLLQRAAFTPEAVLRDFGLLKSEYAEAYEKFIQDHPLEIQRPWHPAPRVTLANFHKPIDIPAHSLEEHAYLNSLKESPPQK